LKAGRQYRPSRRSTLKHRKTEENFIEINILSLRTRMYNQLITKSESISKLNRDIKES
jgi:hypothetical protein